MSDSELRGVTLRIYLHLLSASEPLGVRDISRDLGIPVSTVHYHVKKLKDLGLIREGPEGYEVARRIKVEGFVFIGWKLVPRLAVYSAFFAGVVVGLLAVSTVWGDFNVDRLIAVTSSLTSSLVTALEARRIKKSAFS